MHFKFNLEKTLQASAELLRYELHQQMSRLRLMKLLYIADREALKEIGRPITGDHTVAMKHGPVLSRFYDIIKGEDAKSPVFDRYFEKRGYQVFLCNDPGKGQLNRYQVRKLQEISDRFKDHSDWDIVEYTHEFPEWKNNNPGGSSKLIPLEDILVALGYSSEHIESIKCDSKNIQQLHSIFQ